KEEESTVLPDRSADGEAEIVPAHRSNLYPGLVIEVVVGVELVIAEELIGAAMEIIGPRARYDIDDGSSAEPNFRTEIGLLHFELLHSVNRRRIEWIHNGCILLNSDCAHSVNQDVGLRIAAAIGDKVVGHGVGAKCVPSGLADPRRQHCQVEHSPTYQRKIINEGSVEFLPGDGILAGENWRLPFHLDRFTGCAHSQRYVHG